MNLKEIQDQSFRIATEHGFWKGPEQDNIPSKLALIHSEISEALGEFREGHEPAKVYWHYRAGESTTSVDFKTEPDGSVYFRRIYDNVWHRMIDYHGDMLRLGYEAKPEGFGIELADALIRIADLAERHGIDLEAMIKLKAAYNENRPHMHGRKV